MSDQFVPTELPPRLRDVLAEIPEDEHGPSFQLLFFAAATAIDVLGDLDFTHYEIDELALGDDLWDALAPAVEDTTNSVGAFLECVRTLFAVEIAEPEAVDDELDSWFEELESRAASAPAAPTPRPERQLEEVTALLQAISDGLTHEMGRFRTGLGRLQLQPDRWLLLDHIATFRGKLRGGIGAMVYLAARLFLDVTREEVVPAYRDEVENAVLLRRELARLRDVIRMHHAAARRSLDATAMRSLLARVDAELDAFFASRAWLLVRTADKRPFGKARRDLQALLASDGIERDAAFTIMEGLTRFLESLTAINARETLMIQDSSAISQIAELLAATRAAADLHDRDSALEFLRSALALCERLQGRDEPLDAVCRILPHVPLDRLSPLELGAVVRTMEEALRATTAHPSHVVEGD